MKKLFIVATVFCGFAILASCKQDYSCQCTGVGVTFSYDTLLTDLSKKDAEAKCDDMDVNIFGLGQECELE